MIKTVSTIIALNKLEEYQNKTQKEVRHFRSEEHRNNKDDQDFPNAIVCCVYGKVLHVGRSMSSHLRHYNIQKRNFVAPLEESLMQECAKYGVKNPLPTTKNVGQTIRFFGTCAEDDAANKVLDFFISKKKEVSLRKLSFTKAIRPRTGEVIPYCQTCINIFS